MNTFLRRAALAVATTATAAVAVMSLGGAAEASTYSAVLVSPRGEATIILDQADADFFWFTGRDTCDALTWDLNAKRQSLGLSLGVSTDQCVTILRTCIIENKDDLVIYVDADNDYACLHATRH